MLKTQSPEPKRSITRSRLIKSNAILHFNQRERDGHDLIASAEDLKAILPDFKLIVRSSFYGVSEDALMLLDAMAEEKRPLSLSEISVIASKIFGAPLPESTLRLFYVKDLVKIGLLEEEVDQRDKRRRLYSTNPLAPIGVFDDEEALFAEIEGKPIPSKPSEETEIISQEIPHGPGSGGVEDKVNDKNWIRKQLRE